MFSKYILAEESSDGRWAVGFPQTSVSKKAQLKTFLKSSALRE